MNYFTIASIVQGISEAFPVSSSAHLLLLSHFLNFPAFDASLPAILHIGSFLALCLVFFKEIGWLVKGGVDTLRGRATKERHFLGIFIIATLPAVGVGAVIHFMKWDPQNSLLMALCSLGFGIVLYTVDRYGPKKLNNPSIFTLCYAEALFIGVFQSLALLPGVSRLGICITAGRLLGYSLYTSTRFGFVLGLASIGGALVLKIPSLVSFAQFKEMVSHPVQGLHLVGPYLTPTLLTMGISLFFISFFLFWTKRYPLWPIIVYRLGIGLTLLYFSLRHFLF